MRHFTRIASDCQRAEWCHQLCRRPMDQTVSWVGSASGFFRHSATVSRPPAAYAVVIPLCGYGPYPLPRVRCACTQPRLPFPKRHGSFRGNAGADSSPALGTGEGEVASMRSVQRPRPAAPDRTAGLGASCCCVTCRSAPHNNMYTTCRCPGLAASGSSPSDSL